MKRTPRVLIAGGSLGGLLTAHALQSVGCEVEVHERSSGALESRGAGIRVQRYMRDLLAERAGIDLDSVSTFTSRLRYLGLGNEVLSDEPEAGQFSSWNGLWNLLRAGLSSYRYRLGCAVVGFSELADGVNVRLSDGTDRRVDLLVFADGLSSAGRQRLAPSAGLQYAGYVAWRGFVPQGDLEPETQRIFADATVYMLHDFGHLAAYAIAASPDAAPHDHIINYVWYRNVEAGGPLAELTTDRFGYPRPWSVPPGAMQTRAVAEARSAAAKVLPPAGEDLLAKVKEPFIQVVCDVESPRMAFGRVCLVGDSAFTARPHVGAATAKATLDAWTLADALAAADGNVPAALAEWEPRQLQLGRVMVGRGRYLGMKLQATSTAIPGDPDIRTSGRPPLEPDHERRE